ncbi:hypothetical protein [Halomonas daqiaonensis]|uniref:Uncharacterized protein n=1 Tax=Halomonas daqiaonensis TaxID=650850 RepID=A0A1H7RZD5_9GAMM|nr:hypothetical protein [Halomonas daqiaonensis]SEL65650.1 hypothetical protein SAMN04488129_11389 [Halomonas daqiaonensis]
MSGKQVERIVEQIRDKLPKFGSVEKAADEVRKDFEAVFGPLPEEIDLNISSASEGYLEGHDIKECPALVAIRLVVQGNRT